HVPVELDPANIPVLKKRYGGLPPTGTAGNDPFKLAELLLPIAKNVLQHDGYHIRLMHVRTPQGWRLLQLNAGNRAEKFAMLRHIANEVKAMQGDAIVEIAEAWMAPLDALKTGKMPEEAEDRKEVLVLSVATADGKFRSYDTVFDRDSSGKI